MPFDSGRVTFSRFVVEKSADDLPEAVNESLLQRLNEHAFRETSGAAPPEIESGWITGRHIFDTEFSYDKNGFGRLLLMALRIDTNKVPGEIARAYQFINTASMAAGNPSGFASRAQRQEARELAERQARDDLASGKFRRSKSVPVLWDLKRGVVYCGAAGNTVAEQLIAQFRHTLNVDLRPMTSGTLARLRLQAAGRQRDFEDLKPSMFTDPPEGHDRAAEDDDGGRVIVPRDGKRPTTPWAAPAAGQVDAKDFVGNEFLIWLWRRLEQDRGVIPVTVAGVKTDVSLAIDRTLDMECAWGVTGKLSLRGDGPTRLPEAREALGEGKWPRKIGLIAADGEHQWETALQADRWVVSSASLPQIDDAASPRELVEQRLLLVQRLADTLDALLESFVTLRTSSNWESVRQEIRGWIRRRRRGGKLD
jgi:hypothetical protein